MLEAITGPFVSTVETRTDPPGADLFPEERAVIAGAAAARRTEYTTTRRCAHRAMARLGLPPAPVPSGPRGEPLWPTGVVGSLTHCRGYRGAALARADRVTAIGIDAEPNGPLRGDVLRVISLPAERAWIRRLSESAPGVAWDRLLFSAKESVFKAWYPLTRRELRFGEALVTVEPETGAFHARLLVPGPRVHGRELTGFSGRWLAEDGLLLTAIVVYPDRPPGADDPGPDRLAAPR